MGKKKSSKSSKSSKKSKSSKNKSSPEALIEFTTGTTEFHFANGDRYTGDFCAHRSGIVWREGHGVYITQDGQIYEGEWKDDKLLENSPLEIQFPSGAKFNGRLVKNKYSGGGCYTLENDLKIICEFRDNKPKGDIVLLRSDNECCFGDGKEHGALLFKENIFFTNINKERGLGRCKKAVKDAEMTDEDVSATFETEFDGDNYWKNIENAIFAKSTKTAMDIDFTESSWYQDYLNFLIMRDKIMSKIRMKGLESLSEEEARWYEGYMNFIQKRRALLSKKRQEGPSTDMLERYLNEEIMIKQMCLPKIFVPTEIQSEEERPPDVDVTNDDANLNDNHNNVNNGI